MGDARWEDAIKALNRALQVDTDATNHGAVYQNLSICYTELARYEQALEALQQAETVGGDPTAVVYQRGLVYAIQGQADQAIPSFETYERLEPKLARQENVRNIRNLLRRMQKGKVSPGTFQVDYLQEQIGREIDLGEYEIVERKARQMIAADPKRAEGHFALGVACINTDRLPEGLSAFQQALQLTPKDTATLFNMGYTLKKLDRPNEAAPYIEAILRREPNRKRALHELGQIYLQLDRRDEAIRLWQKALKIDRHYEPVQYRLYEVGAGPEPQKDYPPTQKQIESRALAQRIRERMKQAQVYQQGAISLTVDPQEGFVLEDAENPGNFSLYSGLPFQTGQIKDADLLDWMGNIKTMLRMTNHINTRDLAILVLYRDGSIFSYQAQNSHDESSDRSTYGRFVVNEVPLFFKLRCDSDLATAYYAPMQGIMMSIYHEPDASVMVSTLGYRSRLY